MPTALDLKRERAQRVGDMRKLLDDAEGEGRDLSSEEQQSYDRLEGEVDALKQRIDRQERVESEERDLADVDPPDPDGGGGSGGRGGGEGRRGGDGEELAEAFRQLARGERRSVEVDYDARDLTVGTDSAGGHTVPTTFVRDLYESMQEMSAIRQTRVRTITTASGEQMQFPKKTSRGSASLVSEGQPLTESDPSFGQVTLGAWKYGQLLQLSYELLQDTGVNLLDVISRDAGEALGEATGAHYVTGDGSSKPQGIVTAATVGVTAAATGDITTDELLDLMYSVIRPYRRRGEWFLEDSTVLVVRKKKDNDGQYIWQPGLQAGEPDRLWGRPVTPDHNMPTAATGNKSVLFGDFSGYVIRDVGQMRFERSTDFAFDSDLVTFRSLIRTDGDMLDTSGAVKALQQAAA